MWFPRKMLRILSETGLREFGIKRSFINRIFKGKTIALGRLMRREKLEYLVINVMIEGKHSRVEQQDNMFMLDRLIGWLDDPCIKSNEGSNV